MPPFKDSINPVTVRALARRLSAVGEFPSRRFVTLATRNLEDLELKARVAHVIHALRATLPQDFAEAARMVEQAVAGSELGMWEAWPATDWVAVAGLEHPTWRCRCSRASRLTPAPRWRSARSSTATRH